MEQTVERKAAPNGRRISFVRAFVWGVWVVATLTATWWVLEYGRRFPYADEWQLVDAIAGVQPMSLDWLWSQSGEHRLVFLRLTMVPLTQLADGDFRATLILDLVALSGVAAAAIVVAGRVRGRTRLVDAFFPLLLLSLGIDGLNYGFQSQFVIASVAAIAVLLVMVRYGLDVPPPQAWLCGVLMLVMLAEGGPGLALVPALVVWLLIVGIRLRRRTRVQGTLIIGWAGLTVLSMGAYFIGYGAPDTLHAKSAEQFFTMIARVASSPGGDRMSDWWPWSGVLAVALLAAMILLLARAFWRGETGQHTVALGLFGVAALAVLLAVAWGRASNPWTRGLEHHYLPLLLPLCCWVFFMWERLGGRLREWALAGLLGLTTLTYAWGIVDARVLGPAIQAQTAAFERELCTGLPAHALMSRHLGLLYHSDTPRAREIVADGIGTLQARRVGAFRC